MEYHELESFVKKLLIDEIYIIKDLVIPITSSSASSGEIIRREKHNLICPTCKSDHIKRNGKSKGKQLSLIHI